MTPYIVAILIFLIGHVNAISNVTSPNKTWNGSSTLSLNFSRDENIEFHLYTRTHPDKYILYLYDEINLSRSSLKHGNKAMIFIHGYTDSAVGKTSLEIAKAYLEATDYNVIMVNWRKLAAGPLYFRAAKNTRKVGAHVAELVKWLHDKKAINMTDVHLIGFSLGAHAAGFVGKLLGPGKISRITGLDPAGPSFSGVSVHKRLDKTDAIFVDVIHTNYRTFGLHKPIGHADFYPNYGGRQPGCKIYQVSCSHKRARLYYTESVRNPYGFPAKKCREWKPISKNCDEYPSAYMGSMANSNTHGIFLLFTYSTPPYARYLYDYHH